MLFSSLEDEGGLIINRSDEIREVCVWVNVMKIILNFQNIGANIKVFFFFFVVTSFTCLPCFTIFFINSLVL